MEKKHKKNNMRERRPDIAAYMDNYNEYYEIVDSNIPEETAVSSKVTIVHCRCEHGHDFSQTAGNISKRKVDDLGIIYCPECDRLKIREMPYVPRKNWKTSFYDYCTKHTDKQYLLDEWDDEKNQADGIYQKEIGYGASSKAWWICPKGHSYDKSVAKRILGEGCPVCKGSRVVVGVNDFLSQCPETAKDWDYKKNNFRPDEITKHSNRRVHWKCHKCGHEWSTAVCSRTSDRYPGNCPKCINHGMSRIEMCLYLAVKKYYPDAEYRKKIDNTEFDITIPSVKIAIEYDGIRFHVDLKRREIPKNEVALDNGLMFFRIEEVRDVDYDFLFENNCLKMNTNINTQYKRICTQALICLRDRFGLPILTDVDDDIIQQTFAEMSSINLANSLAVRFPDIAKEWHETKNGALCPEHLDAHSHINAWWTCSKCGNDFRKPVHKRTTIRKHNAGGCPYCCGQRRKVGFNDLETLFPGISQFWCKEENDNINMKLEECSPTSVKYTYWDFGEGPKCMQIRNAVRRYQNINKSENN
jgi:hypothetical protein